MSELIIRKIIESDLENNFLESLDNLKQASDLDLDIACLLYTSPSPRDRG